MSGYGEGVNIKTYFVSNASLFNQSVTADTDILSADLTLENALPESRTKIRYQGIYTVDFCMDTAGYFSVAVSDGTTQHTGMVNGGNLIKANAAYTFTKIIPEGHSLNFQFSEDATLKWLVVTLHGGIY